VVGVGNFFDRRVVFLDEFLIGECELPKLTEGHKLKKFVYGTTR